MGRGANSSLIAAPTPELRREIEAGPLSRGEFRSLALTRNEGKCLICGDPATDAHHIFNRRLFDDGGYYASNAAGLCSTHHRLAESTEITTQELLERVSSPKFRPPGMSPDAHYDTWGNEILRDGRRVPGPLYQDEGCQRAIGRDVLFVPYRKFPRTPHLPWSENRGADDLAVADPEKMFAGREVVVTEKLDGESFTVYADGHTHARSIDSGTHPARTRARGIAPVIAQELPQGWRVSAENLQARHSTPYERLPSPIAVIAIWNDRNEALSWDETCEWAELLGLQTVPEVWRGEWDPDKVRALGERESGKWTKAGTKPEGYVVRRATPIPYAEYGQSVAKFVRRGFLLPDDERWDAGEIEENEWA